MKVKTVLKPRAVASLLKAQQLSLNQTADELLNRQITDQTMPFDHGNMQNEQTYVDDTKLSTGKAEIVTDAPQAKRLYNHPEYNFQQGKNANAGGLWWEPYLIGDKKDEPQELYAAFFRRNGGGYIQ